MSALLRQVIVTINCLFCLLLLFVICDSTHVHTRIIHCAFCWCCPSTIYSLLQDGKRIRLISTQFSTSHAGLGRGEVLTFFQCSRAAMATTSSLIPILLTTRTLAEVRILLSCSGLLVKYYLDGSNL